MRMKILSATSRGDKTTRPTGSAAMSMTAFAAFFTQCQRRYLATKEQQESEALLARVKGAADSAMASLHKGFGRDAYGRVGDLVGMVPACQPRGYGGLRRFSGDVALAAGSISTLTPLGWTLDAAMRRHGGKTGRDHGLWRWSFKVIDGSDYDYVDVEFVYVANHVTSKKSVLEKVVPQRQRSPGWLFASRRVKANCFPKLSASICRQTVPVQGEGVESSTFLS